jgi:chromosome segregation ATPase
MNETPLSRLSGTYLVSLGTHLAQGSEDNLETAREIGREAVAIGMETLDLARIHAGSLTQLLGPDDSAACRTDVIVRATAFFTEAVTPIEETNSEALKTSAELTQLHAELGERTLDLAAAKDELQRRVAERSQAESTLRRSQQVSDQLLKDSRVLEQQLQDMTHQILSATEGVRHRMSLHLNDEIAQVLLAIHLRILALHEEVAAKHADFTLEIAATRQFVADAAKNINRLAHEFSRETER